MALCQVKPGLAEFLEQFMEWEVPSMNKVCTLEANTTWFFQTQGALWKVTTELCPVCGRAPETTAHLFFECAEVKHRWIKAIRLLRASKMSFSRVDSGMDIISTAVSKHLTNPAPMVLVAEMIWSACVERNLRVFQGNNNRVPLQMIFRNCVLKLEALEATTENQKKLAVIRDNGQFLSNCAHFLGTVSTTM
jgi:hypothetical protein